MPDTKQLRVFLCHASEDKEFVKKVYKRLRDDGIDAWLDKESLLPGQDWQLEIPRIVKNSDVVLVFLSKHSVEKKGYIQKEIKLALDTADQLPEGTIYIVPVRLEECEVPERLTKWHWVDIFKSGGYERIKTTLAAREKDISTTIKNISSSSSKQNIDFLPVTSTPENKSSTPTQTSNVEKKTHQKRNLAPQLSRRLLGQ